MRRWAPRRRARRASAARTETSINTETTRAPLFAYHAAAPPPANPAPFSRAREPSVPAGKGEGRQVVVPLATVRVESELNWPERQQLAARRSLQRPPSKSDGRSDSASLSNAHSAGGARTAGPGAVHSADGDSSERDHAARMSSTCPSREKALWRTLRRSGLLGSPEQGSSVGNSSHVSEYT